MIKKKRKWSQIYDLFLILFIIYIFFSLNGFNLSHSLYSVIKCSVTSTFIAQFGELKMNSILLYD